MRISLDRQCGQLPKTKILQCPVLLINTEGSGGNVLDQIGKKMWVSSASSPFLSMFSL